MTNKKDEALRLALGALKEIHVGNMTPMAETNWNKALAFIEEALAQPEPVREPQKKISAMIEKFEEDAKRPAFFEYQGERINLNAGEIYVGAIGDKNGDFYHLILLPGDNDDANWKSQIEWAKSIGGDLPNRIEQAMLWANFRDEFKRDWYWSNETHRSDDAYAWYQYFGNGYQTNNRKSNELRARAVRRVAI